MSGRVRLMVGTGPAGQGGVASVVRLYAESGLLSRHGIRHVVSHVDTTRGAKWRAAFGAFATVLAHALSGRLALLHAHTASRSSFMRKSVLLAIARLAGARTVFHLHGAEFRQFHGREAGRVQRWWIRHTLTRSSAVIVLSARWRDYIRDIAPASRVHVIPNPVRIDAPAPPDGEPQPGRVLFLGRAERRKGIHELLDAVRDLANDMPSLRLIIGGDGDLEALARQVAARGITRQVEILGWIDAVRRREEFMRAAIFVLPSHDEGLPMAMLEAMAAGKAIIVTPVGGIPDAVTDGRNGVFVTPGKAGELAAALRHLLDDPVRCRQLGHAAWETVVHDYALEKIEAALAELYAGLEASG